MTFKIKLSTGVSKYVTPESDRVEETRELFTPSPQLGELLHELAHEQQEVDRREAERLARLREIQSYD